MSLGEGGGEFWSRVLAMIERFLPVEHSHPWGGDDPPNVEVIGAYKEPTSLDSMLGLWLALCDHPDWEPVRGSYIRGDVDDLLRGETPCGWRVPNVGPTALGMPVLRAVIDRDIEGLERLEWREDKGWNDMLLLDTWTYLASWTLGRDVHVEALSGLAPRVRSYLIQREDWLARAEAAGVRGRSIEEVAAWADRESERLGRRESPVDDAFAFALSRTLAQD